MASNDAMRYLDLSVTHSLQCEMCFDQKLHRQQPKRARHRARKSHNNSSVGFFIDKHTVNIKKTKQMFET